MLRSKKTEFQKQIDSVLRPKLNEIGFQEIILKDCISNEVLFNKGRVWFGASWDIRDQYLNIDFGHLFWFRDVMPRVIILGDYSAYCQELRNIPVCSDGYLRKVAGFVKDTIEDALVIYEKHYEDILAARKDPKKLKYQKEFYTHLGDEVSKNELKHLMPFLQRIRIQNL